MHNILFLLKKKFYEAHFSFEIRFFSRAFPGFFSSIHENSQFLSKLKICEESARFCFYRKLKQSIPFNTVESFK